MGWFANQTLKHITQKHKDVHFVFLFDRPFDEEFIFSDNITPLVVGPQARHPFLYYAWFHVSVKNLLNKLQPDLFLSPDGFLSPDAKCKQLPVIHDINFLHHPKDSKWLTSKYYNRYFPRYARLASRIATVSEYSKKDISENYKIDANKIDVVYNGINEFFKPLDDAQKSLAKKKFSNGCEYFVYVGSINPRKNIYTLIKAFSEFKKEKQSKVKLVIAGSAAWGMGDLYEKIKGMGVEGEVLFTNRLNNEDMAQAVGGAMALTFIPYYEGFGIPLVEAMAAEIPIITSNVTSLPEIAGEAALLVNPREITEVKNAMLQIYSDEQLRHSLVEKGKTQRQKFSWERSGDLLWESIQKTIKS